MSQMTPRSDHGNGRERYTHLRNARAPILDQNCDQVAPKVGEMAAKCVPMGTQSGPKVTQLAPRNAPKAVKAVAL